MSVPKRSSNSLMPPPASRPPVEKITVDMVDNDLDCCEDEEGGTRIGDIYIPPPVQPHCSGESKGSRLLITKISNINFKSYAGEVTLGPFHHRFSSIIGPNGSGKSNVIDSMLFVFGYRAQKIRSKNLSVLLHSSSNFPNTTNCTVKVFFKLIVDKEDGSFEEVPESAFVISRTASKDNSSFYMIDNRKVQFKEVSKLLRSHGIDLDHNRFLILQGEVESISMMKPKGMTEHECGLLEYLEDIIGTTRYKIPLIKINDRVETLNEERTEKHNRCKLAEREMKDLESPKNEAVDYMKLENSVTRTKNLHIQKYLSEQNKKLNELEKDRDIAAGKLKTHDEQLSELESQRKEKEDFIQAELSKCEDLKNQKEENEQCLKEALTKYSQSQATMTATNKNRKQTKVNLAKEEERLIELRKIPDKNQEEIDECEAKIKKLRSEKSKIEETLAKNLSRLKEKTKPLIDEKDSLQTQLIDLKKTADDDKAEMTMIESELKICQHNETAENRKLVSMKTAYESSNEMLTEKNSKQCEHKTKITELRAQLQSNQQKMNAMQSEEKQLSEKVLDQRRKIEENMNAMQSSRSQNRVLNALMKQKADGNIPGILGRLGDLGGIDAKYDVAISTCCGRLDNIVVETVNAAQQCIEYLKKSDIGRASFIALEKIQHMNRFCHQKMQTPENVPRLFDLINVEDSRVLPAFYFALRDTLVANDLDQASRIAYGGTRYRTVTLRGDIIEIAGTMSGGGKTMMRGRMGQNVTTKTTTVTKKDVEDLQVKAEEMQNRVNYLQEKQSVLEKEITQCSKELRMREAEIKRLLFETKSLSEQLPRILDQIKQQEARVANARSDPKKVRELENSLAKKKKEFDQSQALVDEILLEVNAINSKINDITQTMIKELQSKVDALSKQLNKLTGHVSKLTVEINTSDRNCKKSEDKIANMKKEIVTAEENIKSVHQERDRYDKIGIQCAEKVEKLKIQLEEAQHGSVDIRNELLSIQKVENESRLKRLEIEQWLQNVERKLSDVRDQMPHWKNRLKPLTLQEIPGEPTPEPLKTYTEEELDTYKLQDLQYQYSVQEEKLNTNKPNLSVIEEYFKKQTNYLNRVQVLEDITKKRNEMRQLLDDLKKKRFSEFMQGFCIISKKLKEMYQMITLGGDAELELVDSMNPFVEGIVFSVRPPKKSWKTISNLSGGEKTLSSLALVFALHYYKPSPLYVMDEIDAALDFKNVSIVAHYIKERTKNAQFIIISLRSNMFELSDNLVGIFKVYDCTKSVTVKNCPPKVHQPALHPAIASSNLSPPSNSKEQSSSED